jgi:hypothetical protein
MKRVGVECDRIRKVGPQGVGNGRKKTQKRRKKDSANVGLACASLIIKKGININCFMLLQTPSQTPH